MEEEQEEGGAVTPSNEVAPAADSTNVIEPTVLEPIKPEGPEISEGGAKRTLQEMEGPPKEAVPMPSPARPRLNINKSDKGQIGSLRLRAVLGARGVPRVSSTPAIESGRSRAREIAVRWTSDGGDRLRR